MIYSAMKELWEKHKLKVGAIVGGADECEKA
jgi:hypothetical protein